MTEDAHAYTPGLKIKKAILVRKVRRLPIFGEVFVKKGEQVDFNTEIAQTMVPGDPQIINAAAVLGVEKEDLPSYMKKKIGDKIIKGEKIAEIRMFFGLSKAFVLSPFVGYIENISDVSGQITVRENPIPVSIDAYIKGKVIEVIENEGAIIETNAAFVQGIFGVGGEAHGDIKILSDDPEIILTEDLITPDCKGKILVGGSLVTKEALHKAVEFEVSGIVSGGIKDTDLEELLGYEIGVAITGQEDIGITLIITEGFGRMAINPRTLELLKEFNGKRASMSGVTQIRAGVIRPEVIIPHEEAEQEEETISIGMTLGTPIRVIREPYFGAIGKVVSLPVKLQELESESMVRVVEVEFEDGKRAIVPRSNVEIIEI